MLDVTTQLIGRYLTEGKLHVCCHEDGGVRGVSVGSPIIHVRSVPSMAG